MYRSAVITGTLIYYGLVTQERTERKMKKLLFVFILLAMAVPALATVYVYNIKATDTGIFTNDQGDTWGKYKTSYGGYFIFGPGSTDDKVFIWTIWTGKDKSGKWADAEDWGEANRIEATVPSGKTTKHSWIVNYVDPNSRTLLMGDMKVQKVGSAKTASCLSCHTSGELATLGDIAPNVPAKLTGSSVVEFINGTVLTDYWTETLALSFNAKETLKGHTGNHFTAESVKDAILAALDSAGYSTSSD